MTATALSMKSPAAENRPSRPITSRADRPSSAPAAIVAATSGGNSGTWYTSLKRYSVLLQLCTLVRPDLKNTLAKYKRKPRSITGANHSGQCEAVK